MKLILKKNSENHYFIMAIRICLFQNFVPTVSISQSNEPKSKIERHKMKKFLKNEFFTLIFFFNFN